jgi:hypothetical protein
MKIANLKEILKILLLSFIVPFTLICGGTVLIFFVILRADDSDTIDQFVAVLTFGTHCQEKASKSIHSYSKHNESKIITANVSVNVASG